MITETYGSMLNINLNQQQTQHMAQVEHEQRHMPTPPAPARVKNQYSYYPRKKHVLVEGGRNICILADMPLLTSGNGNMCHSQIFSNNMCMNITGTKACNRYMNITFSQLYKIRSDMVEKPIHQHLGSKQPGQPKTNCLQKCSHFLDSDKSPIKCTLCGKAGHNHRTFPIVAP